MSVLKHCPRALALAIFILALGAAPAAAAPQWGLTFTNSPGTLPRSDQLMEYTATIANTASANPQLGDELTCKGAGGGGGPETTVEVEWLRNGQPIAGTKGPVASAKTYVVAAADQGKSLQCLVTVTSDPDDFLGTSNAYAPITDQVVSLPPVVIAPVPSPAPPSGTSAPHISGPIAATPVGTATTTAGSKVLTDVITAKGTGDLEAGSETIENVATTSGVFLAEGNKQTITGPGLPEDTRIDAVDPVAHTLTISKAATETKVGTALAAGALLFQLGEKVSGPGIPAGAEITTAVGNESDPPQQFTLSAAATATATDVPIAGTSELTCNVPSDWSGTGVSWSFQWLHNAVPIPGATNSTYVVQKADTEPPSVLQCRATAKDMAGNEATSMSSLDSRPRPPLPYVLPLTGIPGVAFSNETSGPVSFELELPAGEETLVFNIHSPASGQVSPAGWSCSKQFATGLVHARVKCTREDALPPGKSYPSIGVSTFLGADAPDVGTAVATVSGGGAPDPATEEATYSFTDAVPFDLLPGSFEAAVFDAAGNDYTAAGGHPFRGYTTFGFNLHRAIDGSVYPVDNVKDVAVDVPRGFQGSAVATPELCPTIEEVILALCPPQSAVGGVDVYTLVASAPIKNPYPEESQFADLPLYAIEPEYGQPAQFGFAITSPVIPANAVPSYTFIPELRPDEGYAVSFRSAPVLTQPPLYGFNVDLCDFGAKLIGTGELTRFNGCYEANEAGSYPKPLITNPTRCAGPPPTASLHVDSWQHPTEVKTAQYTVPPITECEAVKFEPEMEFKPTSKEADSPTGLDVEITMPTDGLNSPNGVSQAHLKRAKVFFPPGMAINASAGHGLGACSPAQIKLGTNEPISCPDSSKVGTIEIETPILAATLTGDIFIAQQDDPATSKPGAENPYDSIIGVYLVFQSEKDGVLIKIPGRVEPDPKTGQLVATFDESVEASFSRVAIKFRQGPRSPLLNPPKCGTYAIKAEMAPWSAVDPDSPTKAETVTDTTSFKVTRGPNGGPCPTGDLVPKLSAGVSDPQAGKTSPFLVRLSREDGTQRFSALNMKVPLGLTAYLKGIPYCPDAVINSISAALKRGQGEIEHPSCPVASQIGTASAGAGAGPDPFFVDTGKAYLAGPYKGAPASIVVVAPAVAGPLDLGNVVIRNAVYIDPETTEITVVSDPIPTIIHGVLPDIRDIRVAIDRSNFTLNPTSCEPKSVSVDVKGEAGASASASDRFQVGGCESLGFKPTISTRLTGPTKRGGHPALRGVLKAKPGDANIHSAVVTIPRSEFLDQAHIRTICTRVQFAADACPPRSIYGHATAITPLLDYPLSGPVYLRSSDHYLPDLVVAVKGPDYQPIEATVVGRIDSIKGQIRTSFEAIPDVPLSKVTLNMQGGKKGLLVNSRDICARTYRASLELEGHNGAERTARPLMRNGKCGKARKGKGKRRGPGQG